MASFRKVFWGLILESWYHSFVWSNFIMANFPNILSLIFYFRKVKCYENVLWKFSLQFQIDFNQCFRKNGSEDIAQGRITWLAVVALQRANSSQRLRFQVSFSGKLVGIVNFNIEHIIWKIKKKHQDYFRYFRFSILGIIAAVLINVPKTSEKKKFFSS